MMGKKPIFKRWWFWIVAVVVLFIAMGSFGNKEPAKNTAAETKKETKADTKKDEIKKEDTSKITYDKFVKINMGMTYEQVKDILGEGKETTSSEVNGTKTIMYSWVNPGGSNMNVSFTDNKAMSKTQLGLNKNDAKVTMEKYNKIETGMTYDQVKNILGEGQIVSMTQIMESSSIIYSWANTGGSNMTLTFQDGKVVSKAQFNLK